MNPVHERGAMLDLYQLKTFFVFGKVFSFTEAADILNLTQSAVSHSVRKLEASADVKLVERTGRRFKLTRAGRELYRIAESVFYQLEEAEEILKGIREASMQSVTIGSPVEFGVSILLRHIRQFVETHPDIHLNFHFSHHLAEPFIRDEVDFIIDCKEQAFSNTEKIRLFHEQYVAIASPAYIRKHGIGRVEDLNRVNVLSLDEEGEWWHNFLVSIPHREVSFRKVNTINHVRGLIHGATEGLGVAFVPRYTVINELETGVLVDPFPDVKPIADLFCIYIKREKLKTEKNRQVVSYLKSIQPSEFGESV